MLGCTPNWNTHTLNAGPPSETVKHVQPNNQNGVFLNFAVWASPLWTIWPHLRIQLVFIFEYISFNLRILILSANGKCILLVLNYISRFYFYLALNAALQKCVLLCLFTLLDRTVLMFSLKRLLCNWISWEKSLSAECRPCVWCEKQINALTSF